LSNWFLGLYVTLWEYLASDPRECTDGDASSIDSPADKGSFDEEEADEEGDWSYGMFMLGLSGDEPSGK